jgi:hypothetical protein
MAIAAKDLAVVTRRTVAFPSVALGGVPDDKVGGMEGSARFARMTVAAEALRVAALAREFGGGRDPAMLAGEVAGMSAHGARARVGGGSGGLRHAA